MYFYPSTTKLPTPKIKQHVQHIPNPFSTILHIKKTTLDSILHSTNSEIVFSKIQISIFAQKSYVTHRKGTPRVTKLMKWNEIGGEEFHFIAPANTVKWKPAYVWMHNWFSIQILTNNEEIFFLPRIISREMTQTCKIQRLLVMSVDTSARVPFFSVVLFFVVFSFYSIFFWNFNFLKRICWIENFLFGKIFFSLWFFASGTYGLGLKKPVFRCHPERLITLRKKLYTRRTYFLFNKYFFGKEEWKKIIWGKEKLWRISVSERNGTF